MPRFWRGDRYRTTERGTLDRTDACTILYRADGLVDRVSGPAGRTLQPGIRRSQDGDPNARAGPPHPQRIAGRPRALPRAIEHPKRYFLPTDWVNPVTPTATIDEVKVATRIRLEYPLRLRRKPREPRAHVGHAADQPHPEDGTGIDCRAPGRSGTACPRRTIRPRSRQTLTTSTTLRLDAGIWKSDTTRCRPPSRY